MYVLLYGIKSDTNIISLGTPDDFFFYAPSTYVNDTITFLREFRVKWKKNYPNRSSFRWVMIFRSTLIVSYREAKFTIGLFVHPIVKSKTVKVFKLALMLALTLCVGAVRNGSLSKIANNPKIWAKKLNFTKNIKFRCFWSFYNHLTIIHFDLSMKKRLFIFEVAMTKNRLNFQRRKFRKKIGHPVCLISSLILLWSLCTVFETCMCF